MARRRTRRPPARRAPVVRRRRTQTKMARRRSVRSYLGGLGSHRGKIESVLAGALAGAGAKYGQQYLGQWAAPAAFGGVGFLMNNETLLTMAGIQLANQIPMPGAGQTPSGGWV